MWVGWGDELTVAEESVLLVQVTLVLTFIVRVWGWKPLGVREILPTCWVGTTFSEGGVGVGVVVVVLMVEE